MKINLKKIINKENESKSGNFSETTLISKNKKIKKNKNNNNANKKGEKKAHGRSFFSHKKNTRGEKKEKEKNV